jgi:hypothetical protein
MFLVILVSYSSVAFKLIQVRDFLFASFFHEITDQVRHDELFRRYRIKPGPERNTTFSLSYTIIRLSAQNKMQIKLNISSTKFRLAILGVFAGTVIIGAILGNIFHPSYFLVFLGGFWVLLGILLYSGWLSLVLNCNKCGEDATPMFEFREGPLGERNYPVIRCATCNKQEIV